MGVYKGIFSLISKLPYYNYISSIIGETLLNIFIFTLSLIAYGIFVWKLFSTLGRRDLFKINIHPYMSGFEKVGEAIIFIFKYTFAFPFYTFIWFLILSLFLLFMSNTLEINDIFFVSITLISSTRALAYYNEELSLEYSRIVPMTLLLIFISNPDFFSYEIISNRLNSLLLLFPETLVFLVFIIVWEWILRILFSIKELYKKGKS